MALKAVPMDRLQFADTMVRDIKSIIVAKYGCKVVMEAIHALSPTDVNLIVEMMANNSSEIINDGHAVGFLASLLSSILRTYTGSICAELRLAVHRPPWYSRTAPYPHLTPHGQFRIVLYVARLIVVLPKGPRACRC